MTQHVVFVVQIPLKATDLSCAFNSVIIANFKEQTI